MRTTIDEVFLTDEYIAAGENTTAKRKVKASLTVEAALVLPVFIYFIIAFIYFIQIFILQEHIQEVITKKGLSMAKTAYIYSDFTDALEAKSFDQSLFGEELDINLLDIAEAAGSGPLIKGLVSHELNISQINSSCIYQGFDGISFYDSTVLKDSEDIDIIVRYRVRIPIPIFGLGDMRMIQRVRLRAWNGHQVPARYSVIKEDNKDKTGETMVFITDTGTVYHLDKNCSHIKLTINEVRGIPNDLRNESGGRYYPCEACCKSIPEGISVFYITPYGDRYHINKSCSTLKRSVREVPLSEVGARSPCKRCGQ